MTRSQRLLDRQLPGGIDHYVTERRATGSSWSSIERDICEQVDRADAVTAQTLRRWYGALVSEVAA